MIESIRSYLRLSRLAKALHEIQQRQYTTQSDAVRACQELFFTTGKDYGIVTHQQKPLFWVVRTASAKILASEGYVTLSSLQ